MKRFVPCRGFTLVEIMLVLVILGIVTAVTLPLLGHSIRGNRMRMATRTVVTAGRYARCTAVVKQKLVTLTFDLGAAKLRVSCEDDSSAGFERQLEKVRIENVQLEEGDKLVTEGVCKVLYRNNGTCTPYRVRLTDERNRQVTVAVDALSSAETEEEE